MSLKRAGSKMHPPSGKQPRVAVNPDELAARRPAFRVGMMDLEWRTPLGHGWLTLSGADWLELQLKNKNIEAFSWLDLKRAGSHNVSLEQVIREAQTRLENDLHLELDEIFSVRLSGKERIWGMKIVNVLHVIWFDPEHEICPAPKKNT